MEHAPTTEVTRTSHLDVAAFLIVRGFEVAGVEGDPRASLTFVFTDPSGRGEAAILHFYQGAQVPAQDYSAAQRRVRDLMWEARRRNLGKDGKDNAVLQTPSK